MLFDNANFPVAWEGQILSITEHKVSGSQVFHVQFPDGRKPLALTQAKITGAIMWMSIPQGRQKEAEEIGKLIQKHFDSK